MRVRLVLLAVVVVAGGGLWWVSGQGPLGASQPESDVAASSGGVTSLQPSVSASPSLESSSTSADGGLSGVEARAVLAFSSRFARTFARPVGRSDYRAWWRQVAAMMTDSAASDYVGTDPSLVPYTRVTGPLTLLGSGADETYWVQRVKVPTDAGVYVLQVQLVTPGLSDRLLVVGIEAP